MKDNNDATDVTDPSDDLAQVASIVSYQSNHGRPTMSRDYDENHSNEYYNETFDIDLSKSALARVEDGFFVIKRKNARGDIVSNDAMYLGDFSGADHSTGLVFSVGTATMAGFQVLGTDVYYASLSSLGLLGTVNAGELDVSIQDDQNIDFVGLYVCGPGL